ncbi:hypothetical protein V5O48_018328 [Marasmius crinis-equi]|uniref:Uncharacterized protein n=1 Tax=Marasmius crinis-equi TaxID=585013 RepID=A0ABR3ELH1_9AGAR
MSYAQCYYARQVSLRHDRVEFQANRYYRDEASKYRTIAGLYLLTPSIPLEEASRVKSVSFRLRSADQGWATFGGNGTYHNSRTWFEASILRPKGRRDVGNHAADFRSDGKNLTFRTALEAREELARFGLLFKGRGKKDVVWRVHHNITARSEFTEYDIEWTEGQVVESKEEEKGMGIGIGDGKGFVESLRKGDRVALWARAEQHNWRNIVDEAMIVITYEVPD